MVENDLCQLYFHSRGIYGLRNDVCELFFLCFSFSFFAKLFPAPSLLDSLSLSVSDAR